MEEAPQHFNNEAEVIQRTAVAFHFLSGQWFPINPQSNSPSMLIIAACVGTLWRYRTVVFFCVTLVSLPEAEHLNAKNGCGLF